jgi:hypothetical protein
LALRRDEDTQLSAMFSVLDRRRLTSHAYNNTCILIKSLDEKPHSMPNSFLILIGRFVTLDAWQVRASHPCTDLMIMEAPLRLAVD